MCTGGSRFDISRFGMEVMRFSPRQADVLIVSGTVTYKMALAVKRIWDQMPEPKWCVAMGACASSGGMYRSYAVLQGIDNLIPVDVYVSGCPPRPEALLEGLLVGVGDFLALLGTAGIAPEFRRCEHLAIGIQSFHMRNSRTLLQFWQLLLQYAKHRS